VRATVIYDSDCSLCTQVRAAVEALDWLGTLRWIPLQSPEAAQFGIPRADLEQAVWLIGPRGRWQGWHAVKRMIMRLPAAWAASAVVARKSPWAAVALAAVFSPAFNPAGERLYGWVAQNRYRLPGSTCEVPVWDNRTNE
jgi:predicted DCC family thiol-disulfide oxidoreductase YuxK